jgi:7-cyano-7-deazaguanine reductase
MDTTTLSQLGRAVGAPDRPEDAVLERVPNPQSDVLYLARFTAPEFTSLCPVTAQPDFAHLVIDYAPGDWLIESKSLKLFLTSFRNHGAFHEDCTVAIGRRIVEVAEPRWLRIGGYWYPRGRHPHRRLLADGAPPEGSGCPTRACPPIAGGARPARRSRAG